MILTGKLWGIGAMILTGKAEVLGETPLLMPLGTPQIADGLT